MPTQYIEHLLKNIPHQPGVYRLKNSEKEIIYIGKAKDLFKRVGSYFKNIDKHPPKTAKLVENVIDIEYTVTSSELEALVLETNLIKTFRPKYNVLMKDDKNFAYIKVTVNEDYPRILVVRKVLRDKAKYFGPKTAASQIYRTLNLLRKIFPFRNCNLEIEDLGKAGTDDVNKKQLVKVTKANIKFPCLDLHIKRCLAPCIGKPNKEDYRQMINQIIDFLEGKYEDVVNQLKVEMQQAAGLKRFEQAGKIRDKILSIESIYQNQLVSSPDKKSIDVVNYFSLDGQTYFNLFQFREGKLIDQQNLVFKNPQLEDLEKNTENEQLLSSFLKQFYTENANIPEEILLPHSAEDHQILEEWLKKLAEHKVKLITPQKGKKDKLLDLSLENAFSFAKQSRAKWEGESVDNRDQALEKIAQILALPKLPKRMECYDISHLSGTHTVASMSVFENGFPKRDQYRHFKIKLDLQAGSPDDFKSMEEVILRRLKYLKPSLTTKEFKISKTKKGYLIKKAAEKILEFQVISSNKLKTFLSSIKFPEKNLTELVQKVTDKFDSKRIYLPIATKQLKTFETLGFQKVNIELSEYANIKKKIIVVFDKTRNFEDSSFKKIPNLIVIDGGKGQLSYAVKAMKTHNLSIPIISIAKKQEEFFLPAQPTSIQLEPTDPARLMIQHLRDEAHRFAVEYNRKLRKKDYTTSELENITGIGKKITQKLLREFGSLENIRNLTDETLAKAVGAKMAVKIKNFFK
jgi:excinuclease ABC subunit C